ncbi:MAG: GNAT family N-acetyltransferase [Clostridia bacterium]|nr:GNAT family N-acetyltransferase [Clostridia bacterium]
MDEHSKDYLIRYLTTGDLEQYNALLRYAFQVTEQELSDTGWKDEEIKQSKFPVLKRADVLGCFDGEELVSQVAVYPLKANVYGSIYPIGFVTSVCTYPEYTGRGIMKRLMRQSLMHMRERKQPLAMLFPYSIPLYRKMGWEIISNKISFTVKDRQIPSKAKAPGYVRRVDWENRDFMNLHARFAGATHGCLFRNSLAWEEYWRWDEDDTFVAIYYDVHDTPTGYMVYLIKDDIMHIKEMIYLDREAQMGLWEYIRAHDSMIDEVRGNSYFNEPIAFEMDDGDIREMIRPYIMGRIVDVEQFFRLYPCRPDEPGAGFAFEIEDEFLPWNQRTLPVWFEAGKCEIRPNANFPHIRLSIATLTTLLMGYKSAAKLYRMGRIAAEERHIARLDDALLHEAPYISDYI